MHSNPVERRPKPGEKLAQHIWLRALASSGRLPSPTIERVRQIKLLVATWRDEDEDEA